jgi:hypothetical protein
MLIYLLEYANNLMSSSASFRKTTLIDGIMASVIAASAVDRGFESRSGQTKHYKIGSCCFLAKHVALRRKSKDWFTRNWLGIKY